MKQCDVCKEEQAKYRCPRCGLETCCLKCVNKHKTENNCNGERDKTAFVAVNDFTDIHLLSDYRYLEDCGRKNNIASRDQLKRGSNKPNYLKMLEKQARFRKINLRLMPYPMSRRKNNSTTYQRRTKQILWHIEWLFPQADYTTIDRRIPEEETLESVLNLHLGPDADPLVRHHLKSYTEADADEIAVFMKKDGTTGPQTRYYKVEKSNTIADILSGKDIVEYPTFIVCLKSHWSEYKLVDDTKPVKESLKISSPHQLNSSPEALPESAISDIGQETVAQTT